MSWTAEGVTITTISGPQAAFVICDYSIRQLADIHVWPVLERWNPESRLKVFCEYISGCRSDTMCILRCPAFRHVSTHVLCFYYHFCIYDVTEFQQTNKEIHQSQLDRHNRLACVEFSSLIVIKRTWFMRIFMRWCMMIHMMPYKVLNIIVLST